MQISQVMMSYTQPNFDQYEEKGYQPICISRILPKVLHNMSLKVLLPWQHLGSRPPQNKRYFLPPSIFHIHICKWCLICMIPQAYKFISLSLGPHLVFFKLKISNILKSSGWRLEKSELPWKQKFYSRRCVSCRTISLPSFNGLRCKLANCSSTYYLYSFFYLR